MHKKQATKIEKERFFRKDKRKPKRSEVNLSYDTGISQKTITLRFPEDTEVLESEKDFSKNNYRYLFKLGDVTIVYYEDTEKGFV